MKNRRNYYRILYVQPDAPLEVIKSSYKAIMLKLKAHPDLGGDISQAALINEAYQHLKDKQKRLRYDRENTPWYQQTAATGKPGKINKKTLRCTHCGKINTFRQPFTGSIKCLQCNHPLGSRQNRSLGRFEQNAQIWFYTHGHSNAFAGCLLDLSPQGMRFITSMNLQEKDVIKIECDLLSATGYVTHCIRKKAHKNEFTIGIKFQSTDFSRPHGTFISEEI